MKREKGITLIALIITIIVMLILVGVTINVAINGGLFEKAKDAKVQTQSEIDKEQLLAAVVATLDDDEKVVFTGDEGLDKNLPEGFSKVEGKTGIYQNDTSKKQYKVDQETGRVQEYVDDGNGQNPVIPPQESIDDLIPTEGQKSAAHLTSDSSQDTYYFLNEIVGYHEIANDSEAKFIIIGLNGTMLIWSCNDHTATLNNNTQAKKWYTVSNQGEFQLYEGSCPINKNDYTAEQIKNEEYLDRVIASFSSDNS